MRILLTIGCVFTVSLIHTLTAYASPWPIEQNKDKPWFDVPPKEMPVLNVSEGTTNIAVGKPVTSSYGDPCVGELEKITDGDKESVFYDEGHYVDLGPGKGWVQVDLGTSAVIDAVWLWYRSPIENYEVPNDVIVQISSTREFTHDLTTVFNTDLDNTLGLGVGRDRPFASSRFGKLIRCNSLNGRYVRVWGNGGQRSTTVQFVEIEVYGIPSAKLALTKSNSRVQASRFRIFCCYYLPVAVLLVAIGVFWGLSRRRHFRDTRNEGSLYSPQHSAQQIADGKTPEALKPPH